MGKTLTSYMYEFSAIVGSDYICPYTVVRLDTCTSITLLSVAFPNFQTR